MLLPRKLKSHLEVIRFLAYWKIVIMESLLAPRIQYLRSLPRRFLKRVAHIIACTQSSNRKPDQTELASTKINSQQNFVQPGSPEENQKELNIQGDPSMSRLPIVFIHSGNSSYLKYSLAQAKQSNPQSTVYLLGDSSNDCYGFVEHSAYSDYFKGASEFSKIYRHFNTTGFHYELFNFQRWFVLKEFLIAKKLERCLALDSDTMLYADVTEEGKKFEQFDFTLSWNMCGCTFFLNKIEALADFCKFVMDLYTKRDRYHYEKMVAHFAVRKHSHLPGGVCDMTAFQLFSEAHFGDVGEASQIINGSVFDPAISVPHPGFEMSNGIKKIIWRDGYPYGIHVKSRKEIRFNSLHFQGKAKSLMSQFCTVQVD